MSKYITTVERVSDYYGDKGGLRIEAKAVKNIPRPAFEWELVSTCANESLVFYTWRKLDA
jgi:hypothetical protein